VRTGLQSDREEAVKVVGHPKNVRQELFGRATVTLVIIAGLTLLALSLLCLALVFESSEYEKTDDKWWPDLYGCLPVWIAFGGFTGASAISLFYRKNNITFSIALISLGIIWALLGSSRPIRILIAAISTVVISISIASYLFRRR
jgi:hypothetical protein